MKVTRFYHVVELEDDAIAHEGDILIAVRTTFISHISLGCNDIPGQLFSLLQNKDSSEPRGALAH